MFNNPDPFFTQVKRAADEAFGLQGSRFRLHVVAESIGEIKARALAVCDYDANSLPETGAGRRLLTVSELREHVIATAIDLSNKLDGNLYWNFGVEVILPCKSCGQYEAA